MPANVETIAGRTLDALSPHVAGYEGVVLRNRRLLGPLVEWILSRKPTTDALLRTTTAVTLFRAGIKSNVLPGSATATVNFRILPGDDIDAVVAHARKVVDDPEIGISILDDRSSEPSGVARTDSAGYRELEAALARIFPAAAVAPALVLGGTDSKHYARIADDAYRFGPLELDVSDTARLHGVNERIAVDNYARAIDFYEVLMRGSAGP